MNSVKILKAAKTELIENGWVKGHYFLEEKHCVIGAIGKVQGISTSCAQNSEEVRILGLALGMVRYDDRDIGGSVILWNDMPSRTFTDVIDAFDQAILKAKEESA